MYEILLTAAILVAEKSNDSSAVQPSNIFDIFDTLLRFIELTSIEVSDVQF